MAMRMNKALAFFSAFVGTVKNGQMFIFQIRSTFKHHGSAYIIIGGFYLFISKSKCFQQAPFKIIVLFRCKAKTLQAFFTQGIFIENKTNFKSCSCSCIQFFISSAINPFSLNVW